MAIRILNIIGIRKAERLCLSSGMKGSVHTGGRHYSCLISFPLLKSLKEDTLLSCMFPQQLHGPCWKNKHEDFSSPQPLQMSTVMFL